VALLDQHPRRAGADLALVEGEHAEALERLVEEVVVGELTSSKKMFGLLPPSSSVTGIRFSLAYCMIRRPVVVSPVNGDLGDPAGRRQRLARPRRRSR
jgi:hypothetical protein